MGHSALGDSRSLSQLKQRAVDQPEAFVESMSAWQASLGKACEERDFFETAGKRAQKVFLIVAGVTAVAADRHCDHHDKPDPRRPRASDRYGDDVRRKLPPEAH